MSAELPMTRFSSEVAADSARKRGRLLLVDDEPQLLRTYERALSAAGFVVSCAADGAEAIALLRDGEFDAALSDISMPGMTGLEFLRAVRERDLDLPVILMTANPALETAVEALEYGALRYLVKPVEVKTLSEILEYATRLYRLARLKREALASLGAGGLQAIDRAGLETSLGRALRSLWMAYHPIVRWSRRELYGFEALLRSDEPTLPTPAAILDAAERLGRLHDVGQAIRERVAQAAGMLPDGATLFVNVHPHDLADRSLFMPHSPLAKHAHRIVLEITEGAPLGDVKDLRARVAALRHAGYRIAIDDLGAGYASLTSFAQLQPEVVKLDMALVRDVDRDATKQKLIRSMVALCGEMGLQVIAEGVETAAERDALSDLGCDLLQGYLFARPAPPFPPVRW